MLSVSKSPNCAAIIHIERSLDDDDPYVCLTVVPIAYGPYRVGDDITFGIEPPAEVRPGAKFPLFQAHSHQRPSMNDSPTLIKIGTRGSELALVQATATEAALAAAFPDLLLERVIIKTTGDRRTDVALADVAKAEGVFDKGVFIKELELALDDGTIDIAVHSLKDLPTVLDPAFRPGRGAGARVRPGCAGHPRWRGPR